MIFKVQRPLSDPGGEWLVYRKGKKDMAFIAAAVVSGDLRRLMGSDVKCYVSGVLRDDGTFVVHARVPEEDW